MTDIKNLRAPEISLLAEKIKGALSGKKISISEEQSLLLAAYEKAILSDNQSINLTAITEEEEFIERHYADSLAIVDLSCFKKSASVLDLGTGGGFPGVPLAIYAKEKEFTLLDSLGKRLKIIDQRTGELGIENINTLHGRAEELAQKEEYREAFDLCVSRAVADLAVLSELALPFVKPGGYFVAYKGPDVDEEVDVAKFAIKTLGGRLEEVLEYGQSFNFVIIAKEKNTPKKYPRKPGDPGRNPLKQGK